MTSLGNGTEGTVAKFNVAMAYAYNPCTCVVIVPVAGSRHVRYWCECFAACNMAAMSKHVACT